jgi:hypothetical protein
MGFLVAHCLTQPAAGRGSNRRGCPVETSVQVYVEQHWTYERCKAEMLA